MTSNRQSPVGSAVAPKQAATSKITSQPEPSHRAAIHSLRSDPKGVFQLGHEGVMRSFDGTYDRNVIGAVALSPAQIKSYLDSFPVPWSQETEDLYRGVDGRDIAGEEALFHPSDDLRPPKYTEDRVRVQKDVEEKNREIREMIEKEEREGVDIVAKYACGRVISDSDLGLKKEI
ncbi:hypothetical protein BKA65DRAFT_589076 [Rhexocercosporidium sp. MPI-PUGE-AT-0058]|nr:hypothetical protein BKA65DRAFT_589076 [Rhexocercosporidium sp. MPI-PUGE-AT-0058]